MLLPILRVALECPENASLGRIGEGVSMAKLGICSVGYDTVQGDTKRLIAVFFKEQKELNNRCSFTARCSSRMVAFQTKTLAYP